MASIAAALGRIKSDLEPYLPAHSIYCACDQPPVPRWLENGNNP
jgi:hypothetical protein